MFMKLWARLKRLIKRRSPAISGVQWELIPFSFRTDWYEVVPHTAASSTCQCYGCRWRRYRDRQVYPCPTDDDSP